MKRLVIDDTGRSTPRGRTARPDTVLILLDESVSVSVREAQVVELEDRVRELVGREPKDFARAAVLIYDIFRLSDERGLTREIARVFDLPAMVLYQVPPLVRSIHRLGPTPSTATRDAALERIDDLCRLVIMALDGDADADVVERLVDLRKAVSKTPTDPERPEAVAAAANRLTNLVNAFFFDRLTAMPVLRNYVVGLELGL
ncbi:MAG: hypothetical protein M3096_04305 [Actinomycetia bacterium]|nr:hypothetical protein [Actinomycetes bacterium]